MRGRLGRKTVQKLSEMKFNTGTVSPSNVMLGTYSPAVSTAGTARRVTRKGLINLPSAQENDYSIAGHLWLLDAAHR